MLGLAAVGLFIGTTLMELRDLERKAPKQQKPAKPKQASTADISGQVMLHATGLLERKQKAGESLHEFMQARYHGLYLLGRIDHVLTGSELDSRCQELAHFHKQCFDVGGSDAHRALVEWYSTSGQSRRIPLLKLLETCNEVDNALDMPAYIGYCLTGENQSISQLPLNAREWDQIKRYLSLG